MYKILLADDVKLTLATERAYLEGRNLKVFTTTSANEAITLAGVVQPDLVVLDFEMPEMTGDEVCRRIKQDPRTVHIPVLILSMRDAQQVEQSCREAGAAAFIHKSAGRDALLTEVARLLGVPVRRHVRVTCQFTAGISEGTKPYTGTVENISEGGMFLRASRRFETGLALRMAFTLPGAAGEVHVLGEVVRVEDFSDQRYGLGIQFLEIDRGSQDGLAEFLKSSL
ncbi:MAG TPA: response regulator [Candidatus Polarisedimenticolia bacterium]|nr:response regulator [Candidatus Polarisedimenticolia bacterium]